MREAPERCATSSLRRLARAAASLGVVALVLFVGAHGTENAVANGDTRTLSFFHTHRKDTLQVTFKRNGRYDQDGLKQINHFLRDWRNDQATTMEPRLFDVLWEIHREMGISEAVHVVSAYRSPQTNAMLRSRSRGVAEFSQHMLGRAIDFYIPGASMARVREIGLRLQRGGVGYYPSSASPFVHLDVGNVRHWPRMTRTQLARIFPDGRTVHLPADGRPMPGYELALADVARGGGSVGKRFGFSGGGTQVARRERGFLERFLGIGEDEEETEVATAAAPVKTLRTALATEDSGRPIASAAVARAAARAAVPAATGVSAPEAAELDRLASAASRVPLPESRPAAILAATSPISPEPVSLRSTESAPSAPADMVVQQTGPRMVWQRGPQGIVGGAAAALDPPSSTVAALAPAMPTPRPGAEAAGAIAAYTASAGRAGVPNRADGRGPVLASASLAPTPQIGAGRALAGPALGQGAEPVDRVAKAYPATEQTSTAAPRSRAEPGAATAALLTAALDDDLLREMIVSAPAARDPAAELSHPDRRASALLAVPARVMSTGFDGAPAGGLETNSFGGSAVAIVPMRPVASSGGGRAPGPLKVQIPGPRS